MNETTRKVLPTADPPVWATVVYAFPLSILAASKDYLPWFYTNFIQLCVPLPPAAIFFYLPFLKCIADLLPCPLLKVASLDQDLATNLCRSDIVRFLIDCLDADYYVKLEVDYFFLPPMAGYRQHHFTHPVLVFGYDAAAQTFYIRCYDSRGQFAPHQVAFSEIEAAQEISAAKRPTILYKYHIPVEPEFQCSFDLDLVVQFMSDYLDSRDSSARFRVIKDYGNVWGLEVYDWLSEQIDELLRQDVGSISSNLTNSFRLLWEHKKCMVARIQYMCNEGYLSEAPASYEVFSEIERKMSSIRLAMLRWESRGGTQTLESVKFWIQEIAELERRVWRAMLAELRSPR